jgi:hypothetical protein
MRYSAPFISSTKKSTAALIALYNVYGESDEGARLTALYSATNLSAGEGGGSQGSEEVREARRMASLLAPVTVEDIEREVQVLLRGEREQPVVRAPKRQTVSWTDIADCVPGK